MSKENMLLRKYVRQKTLVNQTPENHDMFKTRQLKLAAIEERLKRRLVKT